MYLVENLNILFQLFIEFFTERQEDIFIIAAVAIVILLIDHLICIKIEKIVKNRKKNNELFKAS